MNILIPVQPRSLCGYMKGTVKITGDIVAPVDETWSVQSGDEDHLYTRSEKSRTRRGKATKHVKRMRTKMSDK